MKDWEEITTKLSAKLDPAAVKPASKFGPRGDYIEGWHAISEANRIFGFDGWSYEISHIKCVAENPREIGQYKKPGFAVTYTAAVNVRVGDVLRVDVGAGHGYDADPGLAHESAVKEAVTDALKRALRTFGNPFGLALYDKTRSNVGVDDPVPTLTIERRFGPETGEIAEERDPPSVANFIDQVREGLGTSPTREELERGYAMAVIENVGKRKGTINGKKWFDHFCDLHAAAIERIRDADLKRHVRSAIAFKQAEISGEKPDPAEFGYPFGEEVSA